MWTTRACFERLLRKAPEVRQRYQTVPEFLDLDFERSLTQEEMARLQNAWMNDVESWMSQQCFDHYQRLIAQANELDKGKGKGSAGKGKFGPRQMALQLKKQRFNKFLSDLEPAIQ